MKTPPHSSCSRRVSHALLVLTLLLPVASSTAQTVPTTASKYKYTNKTSANLRVHFMDIGPGDAILIETPGSTGNHSVLDGGKLGGTTILIPYLKHFLGARPMALAIVTHPDYDHYLGMQYAFNAFSGQEYWDTGDQSTALPSSGSTFQGVVDDEVECDVYTPISACYDPGETYDLGAGVTFPSLFSGLSLFDRCFTKGGSA